MSGKPFYKFQSIWRVAVAAPVAFEILHDLGSYPAWWREVKEARELDEGVFDLRCRSFLPYDLRFISRLKVVDRANNILESNLEGDLEGFSRWTIHDDASGSALVFDEEVVTNKRSLNLLAPVARPAFRFNHTLMMRHGRQGFAMYAAGFSTARTQDARAVV
ncbi:MAG: SRPBCC family protein [Actinomycetota bacterium]